jgi:ParB/RepB/Spo0J family partition protein
MKIDRYEEIPLENLTIGASQARVRKVNKGIGELAQSIKDLGLLVPIFVAPAGAAGKYEIITGRRRFLAVQALGWTKIPACVLDQKPSEDVAKAIALTESKSHQPLQGRSGALLRVFQQPERSETIPCQAPVPLPWAHRRK